VSGAFLVRNRRALKRARELSSKKRTMAISRRKSDSRSSKYLTEAQVADPTAAAKENRHGHRDMAIILLAYRHGLRIREVINLRWDQIDFNSATLTVHKLKYGTPLTHPIPEDELRALRQLQREQKPPSAVVFTSARGSPLSKSGFAQLLWRASVKASLGFGALPPMLRHGCGFALANKGHDTRAISDYLGYPRIQRTEQSPDRFKSFWRR
jgi:integrase